MEDYKKLLTDLYTVHDPERINQIDYFLKKYKGKEEQFYISQKTKYKSKKPLSDSKKIIEEALARIKSQSEEKEKLKSTPKKKLKAPVKKERKSPEKKPAPPVSIQKKVDEPVKGTEIKNEILSKKKVVPNPVYLETSKEEKSHSTAIEEN